MFAWNWLFSSFHFYLSCPWWHQEITGICRTLMAICSIRISRHLCSKGLIWQNIGKENAQTLINWFWLLYGQERPRFNSLGIRKHIINVYCTKNRVKPVRVMHACMHGCIHSCSHPFSRTIIHSVIHSLLHAFRHSGIHALIHSFTPSPLRPLTLSFFHAFLVSLLPSLPPSFLPSFLRSLVPSFLRSFVPSFLRSSVPSFLRFFVLSFLRWFLRSSVRSFFCSFVGSYRRTSQTDGHAMMVYDAWTRTCGWYWRSRPRNQQHASKWSQLRFSISIGSNKLVPQILPKTTWPVKSPHLVETKRSNERNSQLWQGVVWCNWSWHHTTLKHRFNWFRLTVARCRQQ